MKTLVCSANPKSCAAIFDKAAAHLRHPGDREVILQCAGGTYAFPHALDLDMSAIPGQKRLIIRGGTRLKTIFTALAPITEPFTKVDGTDYYVCQLPADSNGTYPLLRTIYVNGKIAPVSSTAAHRTAPAFTRDTEKYALTQAIFQNTRKIYLPLSAIEEAGLAHCPGAELHLRVEWEYKIYHIDTVDTADRYTDADGNVFVAVTVPESEQPYGNGTLTMCNRVFFIRNTPSVLKPGQYAYARRTGKLYYYPENSIDDCTFACGMQTNFLSCKNFDEIRLENITFTGVEDEILTRTGYYAAGQAGSWNGKFPDIFPRAGAVRIENVNRFLVSGCTFTDLPCDGLSMFGALTNVTITANRFTNMGASAIRIGRPMPFTAENRIENLVLSDNYLDNIGFTYENSCSVIVTKVRNAQLNHNMVLHSSYTAFSLGWKWDAARWEYGSEVNLENVEVAYNYIKSFLMNMRDGGGIYTLGGNTWVTHAPYMNTVHDNVVIEDELTCPENGFFGSLYHDGASSNWYTANNIVVHNPALTGSTGSYSARIYLQAAWGGVGIASTEQQAAWHILAENNYVVGCKNFGEVFRSQAVDPEHASDMLDLSRDLREKDTHMIKTVRALKKIPEAVRILDFSGCRPEIGKKPR